MPGVGEVTEVTDPGRRKKSGSCSRVERGAGPRLNTTGPLTQTRSECGGHSVWQRRPTEPGSRALGQQWRLSSAAGTLPLPLPSRAWVKLPVPPLPLGRSPLSATHGGGEGSTPLPEFHARVPNSGQHRAQQPRPLTAGQRRAAGPNAWGARWDEGFVPAQAAFPAALPGQPAPAAAASHPRVEAARPRRRQSGGACRSRGPHAALRCRHVRGRGLRPGSPLALPA